MKIIRNNIIPFPGYKAINLFGILFVRKKATLDYLTINHEAIHSELIKELLWIFFYPWYIIEFLFKWIFHYSFDFDRTYKNVSFEREAYLHLEDLNYLKNRKHYNWLYDF